MIIAAPIPITARQMISGVELSDRAAPGRRRSRTPSSPMGEHPLAPEPVGHASHHQQQPGEHHPHRRRRSTAIPRWSTPTSRTSVGSATFRMLVSIPTISRLRHNTPSVHHRRLSPIPCTLPARLSPPAPQPAPQTPPQPRPRAPNPFGTRPFCRALTGQNPPLPARKCRRPGQVHSALYPVPPDPPHPPLQSWANEGEPMTVKQ